MLTKDQFMSSLDALTCSLCLEPYDATHIPVQLPCNHIFGDHCIANVIESESPNNNRCPLCREVLFEQEDFDEHGDLISHEDAHTPDSLEDDEISASENDDDITEEELATLRQLDDEVDDEVEPASEADDEEDERESLMLSTPPHVRRRRTTYQLTGRWMSGRRVNPQRPEVQNQDAEESDNGASSSEESLLCSEDAQTAAAETDSEEERTVGSDSEQASNLFANAMRNHNRLRRRHRSVPAQLSTDEDQSESEDSEDDSEVSEEEEAIEHIYNDVELLDTVSESATKQNPESEYAPSSDGDVDTDDSDDEQYRAKVRRGRRIGEKRF
jgi:hypothetical protein